MRELGLEGKLYRNGSGKESERVRSGILVGDGGS